MMWGWKLWSVKRLVTHHGYQTLVGVRDGCSWAVLGVEVRPVYLHRCGTGWPSHQLGSLIGVAEDAAVVVTLVNFNLINSTPGCFIRSGRLLRCGIHLGHW